MRWVMGAIAAMCLGGTASAMTITSADFKDGAALPTVHIYPRCGGENVSPGFTWSGVPDAARSLVFTMIDVSVKPNGWSHWIVVDLAPSATGLVRGAKELPEGAKAGGSNFGDPFYDGPCPPPGTGTHRYEFTVWAMPGPVTSLPADGPATELRALLAKTALDHATIAASVTAK